MYHEIINSNYRIRGQRNQHYAALFMRGRLRTSIVSELNHTKSRFRLIYGGQEDVI